MFGYYYCECSEELISNRTYPSIVCAECGSIVHLTKMITSSEASAISQAWDAERKQRQEES